MNPVPDFKDDLRLRRRPGKGFLPVLRTERNEGNMTDNEDDPPLGEGDEQDERSPQEFEKLIEMADDYLSNQLSDAEALEFEKLLLESPQAREALIEALTLHGIIDLAGNKESQFQIIRVVHFIFGGGEIKFGGSNSSEKI